MEKIWTYWERAPGLQAFTQGAIRKLAAVGCRVSATEHEASARQLGGTKQCRGCSASIPAAPAGPGAGGTQPRLEGHEPGCCVRGCGLAAGRGAPYPPALSSPRQRPSQHRSCRLASTSPWQPPSLKLANSRDKAENT